MARKEDVLTRLATHLAFDDLYLNSCGNVSCLQSLILPVSTASTPFFFFSFLRALRSLFLPRRGRRRAHSMCKVDTYLLKGEIYARGALRHLMLDNLPKRPARGMEKCLFSTNTRRGRQTTPSGSFSSAPTFFFACSVNAWEVEGEVGTSRSGAQGYYSSVCASAWIS